MVRNKEILRSENRDEFEFERREVSGQHYVVPMFLVICLGNINRKVSTPISTGMGVVASTNQMQQVNKFTLALFPLISS